MQAAVSTDDLTFVPQPKGIPSYWITERVFGASGNPVQIRYLVEARESPSVEQQELAADIDRRFLNYFFDALLLLLPAFRRHIVEQRGQRMYTEEFVLRRLDVLPISDGGRTGHTFFLRCLSDPRYEFVVAYRGERAVQLRVDRDE